jgi:neutral amino acid transport system permease protein
VEAGAIGTRPGAEPLGRRVATAIGRHPASIALALIILIGIVLVATRGLELTAQRGLNGLATGAYIGLGAVGLTLVYGILKLVNFAHGDFLTFGAYIAFVINVSWELPLGVAIVGATAATAALGVLFELTMWGPMRAKKAGLLQLLLMSIGLALLIRSGIQFVAGSEVRVLAVDRAAATDVLGLRIADTQLLALVIGVIVLVLVGGLLRYTLLGKQMRALSDNLELAETTGINTERIVLVTWVFAGGLAGLAGVLLAAVANVKPELGFELLLPIFAAVVLGGIGNAYGALAAGLTLGVLIEWSTIPIESNWKYALGFVVLIVALILRPQGVFGRARGV